MPQQIIVISPVEPEKIEIRKEDLKAGKKQREIKPAIIIDIGLKRK